MARMASRASTRMPTSSGEQHAQPDVGMSADGGDRYALNVSLVVNYGSRLDQVGDSLLKEIVEVETQ